MVGVRTTPEKKLRTTLWEHQERALEHTKKQPRALLSMDVGTGKSLVAIATLLHKKAKKVVIVCPSSMVEVWPEEFDKHVPGRFRVVALSSGMLVKKRAEKASEAFFSKEPTVVVTNFEAAWREPLASAFLGAFPDALIVDEAQKVKSSGSKTNRFCHHLAKTTPTVLCLTGTPLHNSPLDAFGIFKVLDPSVFGWSFNRFRERYGVLIPGPAPGVPYVVGYKNLSEMADKIRPYAFRVEADDVLDLPEKVFLKRYGTLEASARRIYDSLDREFLAWLGEVEKSGAIAPTNVLTKLLRLQQVANGWVTDEDDEYHHVSLTKETMLSEYLDELPKDEPVVVFTRFKTDVRSVVRAAEKHGREWCEISGRRNDLKDFQKEDGPTVCIVQTQAGGAGISLVRARHAVYYTLPWSFGDRTQTMGRLHRPGQTRPVTYTDLLVKGTIDEHVHAVLQKKGDVVAGVLNRLKGAKGRCT